MDNSKLVEFGDSYTLWELKEEIVGRLGRQPTEDEVHQFIKVAQYGVNEILNMSHIFDIAVDDI